MGLLKLLKELVQLVESEDKQLTLLNDWESFSNSFADELKNVKSQAFKQLLIGRIKTKDNMKTVADENLNKLLKYGNRQPRHVSPQGTELSTKPLSGLQKYMELINARKQPNEKSEFESKLEKRINGLLNKPKMRKNAKSIERFDKLLKGRWSKKSSKRKSKSLPDGARERKRSRGD
ncbi:unnamed protein product [Peronospora farinosa]|uniref:Uncharacterized protein n=1 Tax=Peronospora farinosa TaxID=134698 RepID=A0AAV0TXW9_9STRA|nr:unnamed protein product [Peronospora farinosa]